MPNIADELAAALTPAGKAVLEWLGPVEWVDDAGFDRRLRPLLVDEQTHWLSEAVGRHDRPSCYLDRAAALSLIIDRLIRKLASWARHRHVEMYLEPSWPCGWKIDIFGTPGASSRKSELLDVLLDVAAQVMEIEA